MPDIFTGVPGRVLALSDPSVPAFVRPLVAPSPAFGFQSHRSLITRVTLDQAVNYQMLHTLGNDIYIYVFGDRVGRLTLTGLSFSQDCGRSGDTEHGVEKMLRYYVSNKMSARRAPIQVVIGRTAITGFVVSMTNDVIDAESRTVQYALTLMVVPERATPSAVSSAVSSASAGTGGGLALSPSIIGAIAGTGGVIPVN